MQIFQLVFWLEHSGGDTGTTGRSFRLKWPLGKWFGLDYCATLRGSECLKLHFIGSQFTH